MFNQKILSTKRLSLISIGLLTLSLFLLISTVSAQTDNWQTAPSFATANNNLAWQLAPNQPAPQLGEYVWVIPVENNTPLTPAPEPDNTWTYIILGASVFFVLLTTANLLKTKHIKVNKGATLLTVCLLSISMFTILPIAAADQTAKTGYKLATPTGEWDYQIRNYTDSTYGVVRGSDWANLMTYVGSSGGSPITPPWAGFTDDAEAVWDAIFSTIEYGVVYGKEVAPVNASGLDVWQSGIPDNVEVVSSYQGNEYKFTNPTNTAGSPYTVSVGAKVMDGYYTAEDSKGRILWSSTNCTVVWNGVYTACPVGGEIHFTDGRFTFSGAQYVGVGEAFATIMLYKAVTISGVGNGTVLDFSLNSETAWASQIGAIAVSPAETYGGWGHNGNYSTNGLILKDFTIDGGIEHQISMEWARNFLIDNVHMKNGGKECIYTYQCKDGIISNCIMEDFALLGYGPDGHYNVAGAINLDQYTSNVLVDSCIIKSGLYGWAFDIESASNNTITGCTMYGNTPHATIFIQATETGQVVPARFNNFVGNTINSFNFSAVEVLTYCPDNTFSNNIINGPPLSAASGSDTESAFRLNSPTNVIDNRIYGTYDGVNIFTGGGGSVIKGNTFDSCTHYPVYVASAIGTDGCQITENIFNKNAGPLLVAANYTYIARNTINGTLDSGIRVGTIARFCTVENNYIINCTNSAIDMNSLGNNTVTGNTVYSYANADADGVRLRGSESFTVVSRNTFVLTGTGACWGIDVAISTCSNNDVWLNSFSGYTKLVNDAGTDTSFNLNYFNGAYSETGHP